MIIKSNDMTTSIKEMLRGGNGNTELLHIVPSDALPTKSRLFSVATLQPGCGIGVHEHKDETEIYHVLAGEGMLHDDGKDIPIAKGDTNVCGDGHTHGILNTGDVPLVFIAAIILE